MTFRSTKQGDDNPVISLDIFSVQTSVVPATPYSQPQGLYSIRIKSYFNDLIFINVEHAHLKMIINRLLSGDIMSFSQLIFVSRQLITWKDANSKFFWHDRARSSYF